MAKRAWMMFLVLALGSIGSRSVAVVCSLDPVPAATLLFPYFEVDVGTEACAEADGVTTLVSIHNEDSPAVDTWVTLWTDWGEPALSFELFLTGYDTQSINLRDIFCYDAVPFIGPGASPQGPLSDPLSPPPPEPPPALRNSEGAHLRAWFTGQQSPLTGTCAGSAGDRPENLAVGYITVNIFEQQGVPPLGEIDAALAPTDLLSSANVLWGDWFLVDPANDSAQGFGAVTIEADPTFSVFGAGDHTFYGQFFDASAFDAREPLPSVYVGRVAFAGGFDDTQLLIWREVPPNRGEVECGTVPDWWPLAEGPVEGAGAGVLATPGLIAFDERENPLAVPPDLADGPLGPPRFAPSATQATSVVQYLGPSFGFGRVYVDLRNPAVEELYGDDGAQGWVGVRLYAQGRFSAGLPATPLDSNCPAAP